MISNFISQLSLVQIFRALVVLTSTLLLTKATFNTIISSFSAQLPTLSTDLVLLKIVSSVFLFHPFLCLSGRNKGNLMRSIFSVAPKAILVFGFLSQKSDPYLFFLYVMISSAFDTLKYGSLLLIKTNLMSIIRQSLALLVGLLCPIVSYLLINDYIFISAESIQVSTIRTIRWVQLGLILTSLTSLWLEYKVLNNVLVKSKAS